ncbi:MAG TPA: universal stress protein [Candidatus Sulfotelmatobacter sp.]|nr:universal stress protein [Candidatus Sulfotelmatobacter sp.]
MSSIAAAVDVQVKSVLLAFDFSEASSKPLRHSLAIARHFGAKFHLVHVVSSIGYTIAGSEALHLAIDASRRDMQKLQQQLLTSGALTGLASEFILKDGNISEQLEDVVREKHIDVVVVGTHGRGGLGKLLLGSVAEEIFRNAGCFVVTVGPCSYEDALMNKAEPVRPFLFPTDFSAASLKALPYAVSFANQFGARLVLLNVQPAAPIPQGFHWSRTGDLQEMREEVRRTTRQRLEELIEQNGRMAVRPESIVRFGIVSEQILQASHELKADLVVLGLKEPTRRESSHVPWAAAYKVVCGARCPVLTIRN